MQIAWKPWVLNDEMTSKTHRTTASRRPTEEPAQSERKSPGNVNNMNDGVDLGSDNPEECIKQNLAELLSEGDSDNIANIYSIKPDNLYGEDKGGGEREHTQMGNYSDFIEEMDIGSNIGSLDMRHPTMLLGGGDRKGNMSYASNGGNRKGKRQKHWTPTDRQCGQHHDTGVTRRLGGDSGTGNLSHASGRGNLNGKRQNHCQSHWTDKGRRSGRQRKAEVRRHRTLGHSLNCGSRGQPIRQRRKDIPPRWARWLKGTTKEVRLQLAVRRSLRRRDWMKETRKQIQNTVGTEAYPQWTRKTTYGKGRTEEEDEDISIYAQYIARVEQLPTVNQPGLVEYKRLARVDFEKWSQKRQLLELRTIGAEVNSSEEAKMLYVRPDEGTYPQTFTQIELPNILPNKLRTADLLHHQHHMIGKLSRLHTRLRELKREGRMMLRARRRDMAEMNDARFLSQGVSRTRMIYETNLSIRKHTKLLKDVEKTIKTRIKGFQRDSTPCYVDPDCEPITVQRATGQARTRRRRTHCRHHVRLPKPIAERSEAQAKEVQQPTPAQLDKRALTDRWRSYTYKGVQYSNGSDRIGG